MHTFALQVWSLAATTSSRSRLQAASSSRWRRAPRSIVALLLSACACSVAHACPSPMDLTGCVILLSARGFRQLGWRVASGKTRTELLPRSQALCCLLSFGLVGAVHDNMSGESRTVHCSCTTVIGCKTCMGMGLVVLVSCLSFCYTEFLYSLRHPRRHDPSP